MINLKIFLFFFFVITVCSNGSFGPNCIQTCENCQHQTCYITNGTCLFGCSVGFEGEACKEEACAYTNQWIKIPLYWFNNDWFIKTNIFQVFL